jgi:hypothetical protein
MADKYLFTNFASATLAEASNAADTTFVISSGEGQRFPAPAANQRAMLVISDETGAVEIAALKVRTGDTLAVIRGEEGTAAQSWSVGTRVELRPTAAVMAALLQISGGAMEGPIDMNGNSLLDASFPQTTQDFPQISAARIRGTPSETRNEITFRENGAGIAVGGRRVVTTDMLRFICLPWSGALDGLPSYLQFCDGTNGTIDLRDRFVLGWKDGVTIGAKGGVLTKKTSTNGRHGHAASSSSTSASTSRSTTTGTVAGASGGSFSGRVSGRSGGTRLLMEHLPNDELMVGASLSTGSESRQVPGSPGEKGVVEFYNSGGGQPHDHTIDLNVSGTVSGSSGGSLNADTTTTTTTNTTTTTTVAEGGDHQHYIDVTPPYIILAYVTFRADA